MLGCASVPEKTIVWFHNGHEEYVIIHHHAYTPQGREVPDGTPLECWLTGKPLRYEDLTLEGRRVFADDGDEE